MSNRFTYLLRDITPLYAENCPVVLAERALLRDLEQQRSLAQLKFISESDTPIKELTAAIAYKDAAGIPIGTTAVKYQNISCGNGSSFGADKPVLIPDDRARSFMLIHLTVVFEDDSVWADRVFFAPRSSAASTQAYARPAEPAVRNEQQLWEAAEERKRQEAETAERKARMAQEAAAKKERLAQEAAAKKEQLAQEAAAKKEQLAQAAAAQAAAKLEKSYRKAADTLLHAKNAKDFKKAEDLFRALGDYLDSAEQAEICAAKRAEAEAKKQAKNAPVKAQAEAVESEAAVGQALPNSEADNDAPNEPKKKTAKKTVKYIAVAAVVIALAVAAVPISKTYIIPAVKYAQADKLAKNGSYDEAIAIFAELYDYKDAQDRTWQTTYDKGIYQMEQCDYPAAISTFTSLNDFEDARERVKECEYLYGEALMGEKQYADAVGHLLASDGFADADSLVNDCHLLWAEEEYLATNYESAVDLVKRVPDLSMESTPEFYWDAAYQTALYHIEQGNFRDAVQLFGEVIEHGITDELLDIHALRRDAMYAYVTTHNDNTDLHTFTYLTELAEANYQDSKKLYETLYAWSAEITANNSSTTKENMATVDGKKTCYFHFTITGGKPNETIPVYVRVKYPGGGSDKAEYNEMKHGQSDYFYFNSWGNYPKGNCTITVYNANTNKAIGTHSVKLT